MNLTLESRDMLMLLLRGAWYGSEAIPIDLGDKLRSQDPNEEVFHLERTSDTASFYMLWTKDGWQNEMERRLYVASVTSPKQDEWLDGIMNRTPPTEKLPTMEELKTQLINASIDDNQPEVKRIKKLMERVARSEV